ncbi:MAG TPA: hypothetical protein VN648_20480, partial [Candidatus Methylomirabilis sp.]|nr:hypothetical protein [Candidatus Methylomirabilis sp.]
MCPEIGTDRLARIDDGAAEVSSGHSSRRQPAKAQTVARSLKDRSLMRSTRQQIQLELALEPMGRGEAPNRRSEGAEGGMARPGAEGSAATPGFTGGLMEAIVACDNLKKALAQVKRNKGAPGVDGMTVEELTPFLKGHWPAIRAQLLDGTYRPQPVRRG